MRVPLPESAVHLLVADGFVGRGIGGTDVAICGALVPASSLPPSCCPPDCDCALYCPECVRVAACWHAEAGQAAHLKTPGELVTTVNPSPQPYFDRLAATVEQLGTTRSILRQVIALAGDSATLSNEQLRDRLTALAEAGGR